MQPPPRPRVSAWLLDHPRLALGGTVLGTVGSLCFLVLFVVAAVHGHVYVAQLGIWSAFTLGNVFGMRMRWRVARDPAGERARLDVRREKVFDQPRNRILLKAGLLMAGLCVGSIALGAWFVRTERLSDVVGWILIVVGVSGFPYLAYRLRHPAFEGR